MFDPVKAGNPPVYARDTLFSAADGVCLDALSGHRRHRSRCAARKVTQVYGRDTTKRGRAQMRLWRKRSTTEEIRTEQEET